MEQSNTARMCSIREAEHTFKSYDSGMITDPVQRAKMLENFMAPQELKLKVGAQVMLIKNVDETLVNGTMGKVVEFKDINSWKSGSTDDSSSASHDSQGKPMKAGMKAPHGTGEALYPVVEFLQPHKPPRKVLVEPEIFKVELPNGEVQASRTQVRDNLYKYVDKCADAVSQLPLILAWAMSIHKSQGQTLERVKVDLAKVFEKGSLN